MELVDGIPDPETDDLEVMLSDFFKAKVNGEKRIINKNSLKDTDGVFSITNGAVVSRVVSPTSIWTASYTSTGSIICRSRPWLGSLFNLQKHTYLSVISITACILKQEPKE